MPRKNNYHQQREKRNKHPKNKKGNRRSNTKGNHMSIEEEEAEELAKIHMLTPREDGGFDRTEIEVVPSTTSRYVPQRWEFADAVQEPPRRVPLMDPRNDKPGPHSKPKNRRGWNWRATAEEVEEVAIDIFGGVYYRHTTSITSIED